MPAAPSSLQKPDFSGEWVLNRQASTLSPGADAVQSAFVRIEHREPTFRCKGAFVTQSNPFEYEFELLSDGREIVNTHDDVQTVSRLQWDGDALLVIWRTQRPDGEQKISFRYELVDGRRRCEQLNTSAALIMIRTTCGSLNDRECDSVEFTSLSPTT
jgi:hypothetical protein